MSKLYTVVFLFSPFLSLIAQVNISGKIVDKKHRTAIPGANIVIRYIGNNAKEQVKASMTDINGIFTISIDKPLPIILSKVEIQANGYDNLIKKDYIVSKSTLFQIELFSFFTPANEKITKVLNPQLNSNKKDIARHINEVHKSNLPYNEKSPIIEALQRKQIESDSLQNLTRELSEKLTNKEISELLAEQTIQKYISQTRLDAVEINNQAVRIKELQNKVRIAYMDAINCNCESYTDNTITIGFDLIGEDGLPPLPSTENFKMYVYRLESVRKKSIPLIYKPTGQSYMEDIIKLPTKRVRWTFETIGGEFSGKSNYYIEIYNKEFNKRLNRNTEIASLKEDCFTRAYQELPAKINNRNIDLVKRLFVNSYNAVIRLSDYDEEDGDKVSLMLNEKWVVKDLILSKNPAEYTLFLKPKDNYLVFQAESLGNAKGAKVNTARIEIIASGSSQIFELKADLESSQAVKIVKE